MLFTGLHLCCLQAWLLSVHSLEKARHTARQALDGCLVDSAGIPFLTPTPKTTVVTDTCLLGWAVHTDNCGISTVRESRERIHLLELRVVHGASDTFLPLIQFSNVRQQTGILYKRAWGSEVSPSGA